MKPELGWTEYDRYSLDLTVASLALRREARDQKKATDQMARRRR